MSTNEVGGYFVSGGGTTFPLAVPFGEKGTSESNKLQDAGKELIRHGIHHMKGDEIDFIDNAAINIFNSHVVKKEVFASIGKKDALRQNLVGYG